MINIPCSTNKMRLSACPLALQCPSILLVCVHLVDGTFVNKYQVLYWLVGDTEKVFCAFYLAPLNGNLRKLWNMSYMKYGIKEIYLFMCQASCLYCTVNGWNGDDDPMQIEQFLGYLIKIDLRSAIDESEHELKWISSIRWREGDQTYINMLRWQNLCLPNDTRIHRNISNLTVQFLQHIALFEKWCWGQLQPEQSSIQASLFGKLSTRVLLL